MSLPTPSASPPPDPGAGELWQDDNGILHVWWLDDTGGGIWAPLGRYKVGDVITRSRTEIDSRLKGLFQTMPTPTWKSATADEIRDTMKSVYEQSVMHPSPAAIGPVETRRPMPEFELKDPKPRPDANRCDTLGHFVGNDAILYADGQMTARCNVCYERIHIERLPGGQHVVLAKGLTAALVAGDKRTGDIAQAIRQLEEQLDEDEQAIHEARRLLSIAKVKLIERFSHRM